MRYRILIWTGLLLAAASVTRAEPRDLQWWTGETFTLSAPKAWGIPGSALWAENANRWDRDAETMLRWHWGVGFQTRVPFTERWSIRPWYRRIIDNVGEANERREDRYQVDLRAKLKRVSGSKWDLGFRWRWEVRAVHHTSKPTYRIRPAISASHALPLHIDGRKLSGSLGVEGYYDFARGKERWTRYRANAALAIPIWEGIGFSLGYQVEWNFVGRWDDDHMLIGALSIKQ